MRRVAGALTARPALCRCFAATAVDLNRSELFKKQREAIIEANRIKRLKQQGIDVEQDDDDDDEWILPEEKQRLEAEEQERQAAEAARMATLKAERDALDAKKRAELAKFRAERLAKNAKGKKERQVGAAHGRASREIVDEVSEDRLEEMREKGEFDAHGDFDGAMLDVDDKRAMQRELRRERKLESE